MTIDFTKTINNAKSVVTQIEEIYTEFNNLSASVSTLNNTIVTLNQVIVSKDAAISLRDTRITTLEARIKELEAGTTPPPVTPEPPVTPPTTGLKWPKSSDTGHKGNLSNYTGGDIVRKNNEVIENKYITKTICVEANGVTFRNCLFKLNGNYAIWQNDGFDTLTIENCTVDGSGSSGMTGVAVQKGGIIRGCNIFGMVIAVKLWGDNCTVEKNYIHDLYERKTDADSRHFDGIAMLAGKGTIIQGNAIIMPPQNGGTAATFIASQQGAVSNVKVLNNLLMGKPSYTAYAAKEKYAMTGVVYDGNHIEKGIYGWILNSSGAQDTNNVKWNNTSDEPAEVKKWKAAA